MTGDKAKEWIEDQQVMAGAMPKKDAAYQDVETLQQANADLRTHIKFLERSEHAKEVDDLNKDRASRCACRFENDACVSQCHYHTKEVDDLKKQIAYLEFSLGDERSLSSIKIEENADLRQRIAELEAQLQDDQPADLSKYRLASDKPKDEKE